MLQLVQLAMVPVLVLDGPQLLDLFIALRVGHHHFLTLPHLSTTYDRDIEVAVDLLHISDVHVRLRWCHVDRVRGVSVHSELQLGLSTYHLIVVGHVSYLAVVSLSVLVGQVDVVALVNDLDVAALLHLS